MKQIAVVTPRAAPVTAARSDPDPLSAFVVTKAALPAVAAKLFGPLEVTLSVSAAALRTVPPAFGAPYVKITNVSTPNGARTVNVHVVALLLVEQPLPEETAKVCGCLH
ncbi:MAG: hypothetical protein ACREML_05900 [Vulcanimicrobiaceae bacterium]